MLADLAIQGIAVDTKNLGGLGLISTGFRESALNKFLFEFLVHKLVLEWYGWIILFKNTFY